MAPAPLAKSFGLKRRISYVFMLHEHILSILAIYFVYVYIYMYMYTFVFYSTVHFIDIGSLFYTRTMYACITFK